MSKSVYELWLEDVEAGIARELENGEVEYKCVRCKKFVNSFDLVCDGPLVCESCDQGY